MGALRLAVLAACLLAALAGPAWAKDLEGAPVSVQALPQPLAPAGRLDGSVTPRAYRLDLTLDPSSEGFSGRAEIDVTLSHPTDYIDMHGRELAVTRIAALAGGTERQGSWEQILPAGVARIRFGQELPAGPATLVFEYRGSFSDSPAGLFHVKVGDDWYVWSQFESIDARSAFPCFDQPSFKTPFTITLRTPVGLTAVSNAPEVATETKGEMVEHRFAQSLPLPTYLVAMMAGPFASEQGMVAPTPQRAEPLPLQILSTRKNSGRLTFALKGSKEIVRLLENYFGEAFPFPKLDQISSPIMPGAMENAGADLYRDDLLVMDDKAPVKQLRRFGEVVAHELGHQWFGDLVTPKWWDDIWLNESFANWIGYRIGDAWRPDLGIGSGAVAEGFAAMQTDALAAGRPIRQAIDNSAQIDGAFDNITYGKGGHVIAMIAAFMGEEEFRDGVRRYLGAHRYGSATSEDFFRALAEAAGDERIVAAMQSFIEQQGVPLLVFQRDGHTYRVGQTRYTPLGVELPDTHWIVPLCARSGANLRCVLLTEHTASFRLDGSGPLVPNADGAGYYRFELPKRHWDALIAGAPRLSGGEALAVVDSLNASILAGRGNIGELARLARKLIRHPDSHAADAAVDAMGDYVAEGIVDAAGRAGWRSFRAMLYTPLLRKYGFDPRAGAYDGEAPDRTQRRVQIVQKLLGTHRAGKLRRQLIAAAEAYLAGDVTALDPAWFGSAFDLHVRAGGNEAAKALVERALASEDPVFRPAALDAVAASGDVDLARWLLEDLKDSRLRASEKRSLLSGIMSRDSTREFGYQWTMDNLDGLLGGRNGIFFSTRLPNLFSDFCSTRKADQLASELHRRLAGTAGELALERVIERVRNCGVLKDRLGTEISAEFARLR